MADRNPPRYLAHLILPLLPCQFCGEHEPVLPPGRIYWSKSKSTPPDVRFGSGFET